MPFGLKATDNTKLVCPSKESATELTAEDLSKLWVDLAEPAASKAFAGMCCLIRILIRAFRFSVCSSSRSRGLTRIGWPC